MATYFKNDQKKSKNLLLKQESSKNLLNTATFIKGDQKGSKCLLQ